MINAHQQNKPIENGERVESCKMNQRKKKRDFNQELLKGFVEWLFP